LECLVRLASVRRSIFVEDPSRTQFLSHLMSGTKEILQTGQGYRFVLLLPSSVLF
jgi:exportin-7